MSYQKLEIWQMAKQLAIGLHSKTLQLPTFEHYEQGRQIRRSTKSVGANIVEGYGRKYYKKDFIRFIIYALASNDESIYHLKLLFETGSLKSELTDNDLRTRMIKLGIKLNNFLHALQREHNSLKEPIAPYDPIAS